MARPADVDPAGGVVLRDVTDGDLPIFFEQESDSEANYMAAFTRKVPADRAAFDAHWTRIRADPTIRVKTILFDGLVAGNVLSYRESGRPEVSYWIGRKFWGKGIATKALFAFLRLQAIRPIYARVAKDNVASIRVLEKCGFRTVGEARGFANARGAGVEELLLELRGDEGGTQP
jgi:RimJ/RimL family protein N-acetyltransferase